MKRVMRVLNALLVILVLAACGAQPVPPVALTSAPVEAPTEAPTVAPTEVPPTVAPTEVPPTVVVLGPPSLRAKIDVNCRRLPGAKHDPLEILPAGDLAYILGKYEDQNTGTWYLITVSRQKCWVSGGYDFVTLDGALDEVLDIEVSN